MVGNNANQERCLCPIVYTENIGELNSAFIALGVCRSKRFQNALTKIEGFGNILTAENVAIGGVNYWRTVSFVKTKKSSINISFPYLQNDSVLKNPIAIFIDGIISIDAIEELVEKISEELIKENQA